MERIHNISKESKKRSPFPWEKRKNTLFKVMG
jgi:hypothetical protein